MSKSKGSDGSLGDAINPIMDALSEALVMLVHLLFNGLAWGIKTYVFKAKNKVSLKKIERAELKNEQRTLHDQAIGYSVTQKRNIFGRELDKRTHTAIIGASGSGKTVLLDVLMYEDMKNNKPVIFIDPKGDNATLKTFINFCEWTGRDYYIFSEYYNGKGSCSLNPVKEGSVTQIADRIFHSFAWSEEHYAQICRDALEDAAFRLKSECEEVTLESLYNTLCEMSNPQDKRGRLYEQKDIQGILSRLRKLIKSDFKHRLKGSDALSFNQIRESGKCVYIGLSVLGYAEIARSLGKVILGDISFGTYQAYRSIEVYMNQLSPMGVYIDELSAVITDEFIEILNDIWMRNKLLYNSLRALL